MYDAMAYRGKADAVLFPQHGAGSDGRRGEIGHLSGLVTLVGKNGVIRPGCAQARTRPDTVELTSDG
jgi:hypothetical protein